MIAQPFGLHHLSCFQRGWAGLLLLVLGTCSSLAAESSAPPQTNERSSAGVPLKVLNREIFNFHAPLGPYQAEQRAVAAATLIENAQHKSSGSTADTQIVDGVAHVRVNGQTVIRISRADINELQGETLESVAEQTKRRLSLALDEMEELRDHGSLFKSALRGILATAILFGMIWLLGRNRRWVEGRLIRLTADKADQLKSGTLRMVGLQNVVPVLRGLLTTGFWLIVALGTYLWLEYMLLLFPHTRPFGEQLGVKFFRLLASFGQSAMQALPNLGIVFVVWLLARFAATATRRFFLAVTRGSVKSRTFDQATAPITQRLCVCLIWVTAVLVAFPYIPGSQTPAFRGVSVLAGLMISLGSTNLVAQLVGGLILVYNRTCRTGDYVRVGEHEGTLTTIGFFSSRLVTVRNEEIVMPNNQISTSALINYSHLNETTGVVLPVRLSIGYNAPWRQVHTMLREAAKRTPGVRPQPEPMVLQNALDDFYVAYQLNVVVDDPARRIRVLSELHANIQDVFNENGVQIMSPHYRADPPNPVTVPKDKWHAPPATPPA